jgi:hypothetical protein
MHAVPAVDRFVEQAVAVQRVEVLTGLMEGDTGERGGGIGIEVDTRV